MLNVFILYYDGFSGFDAAMPAFQFHQENLRFVALEKREYAMEEKMRVLPDMTLAEVDPGEVDLFIIPGGTPDGLIASGELKEFLSALAAKGKKIGAICGGTVVLAAFGLLDGKRCTGLGTGIDPEGRYGGYFGHARPVPERVVTDGNIVTATGQGFIDFVLELNKVMGMYKNEDEYQQDLKWWKG